MAHPEQPSDPQPSRIDLRSGPASYIDEGQGPTIIAVHGLPGSVRDFRWLAPALSSDFRIIRVDLPGFGGTPWATGPGYRPEDRAEFVLEFMTALGLKRPLYVGHSMGGVVGAALCNRAQDRLRGFMLISSPGLSPHVGIRRIPRHRLSWWLRHPTRSKLSAPFLRKAFAWSGFRGRYGEEVLAHTIHGVAAMDFDKHSANLRALSLPCATVWCEDDPLVETHIYSALSQCLPEGPRLQFKEGGHNPQKFYADEIAAVLRGWDTANPRDPSSIGAGEYAPKHDS